NGEICAPSSNLVLYYTMNDGVADGSNSSNTTITDHAGSNNGTLQNFNLSGSSSNWTYGQNLSQTVYDTVVATACSQYMIPDSSGYWDSTGTYTWTFNQATGASAGCDSIVTYDLTIDTVDNRINQNGIVLSSPATNASFQWVNCDDSTDIVGYNTRVYPVQVNGSYAVKVTQGNCTEWSDCISISNIGLDEYTSSWAIYPNPAVDQFFIAHASSINDVALYDFNGRLLAILPVLEGWVQLPEQISTGVYIVRNVEFGLNTLLSVK
ncbi:T9SS type A sorting domain-containing protein, partial [Schleiferiaceae bacterium]|nr:T9SS type A sorting domain-containing protein [Schleiferiaceae bacterium]